MLILIIVFLILKLQNDIFLLSLYQQKIIKSCKKLLTKDLKGHFICMNMKQKVRIKIQQINTDVFLNRTFGILFVLV